MIVLFTNCLILMRLSNLKDDLPQLSEDEINQQKNAFEWWYFDFESHEGISLVIMLKKRDPLIHSSQPAIHIEYKLEKHTEPVTLVQIYPLNQFMVKEIDGKKGFEFQLGPHKLQMFEHSTISNQIGVYHLSLNLTELQAELDFNNQHQGFLPADEGVYFRQKKDPQLRSCVNFAAPRMNVTGNVTLHKKIVQIIGTGYHDHPWGTTLLFQTHQNWHWTRFYNQEFSIIVVKVLPHKNFEGKLDFVYFAQIGTFEPKFSSNYTIEADGWKTESGSRLSFPHLLTMKIPEWGIQIKSEFTQSLVNVLVYNRSQVKFVIESLSPNKIQISDNILNSQSHQDKEKTIFIPVKSIGISNLSSIETVNAPNNSPISLKNLNPVNSQILPNNVFSKKQGLSEGSGWTEYWNTPGLLRSLLIGASKSTYKKNIKLTENFEKDLLK